MYNRDMPVLRDHGLGSPDGLADVVVFVLLTIQQPFAGMQKQFADVRRHKAKSVYLFGSKRDGYTYVQEMKASLHKQLVRMHAQGDVAGAVDLLTSIPGLGLVKAGFVSQCLGFEVGCLDTHNIARFGLHYNQLKLKKPLQPATRKRKIEAYIELCRKCGGARYLWDSWCDYVGGLYDKLGNGDAVSAFHARALGLS